MDINYPKSVTYAAFIAEMRQEMGRRNKNVVDEEVKFSEELVSTTDTRGVITYANEAFSRVCGYSQEELVNTNHNIVRHPDMPKAAFKDLWVNLEAGASWRGAVKNRCKDGRYYWVDAFVTPILRNGSVVGYQSVRSPLDDKLKQRAERLYKKVNAGKALVPFWSQFKFRLVAFIALGAAIVAGSYWLPLLSVLLLALPFVCFQPEIFSAPQFYTKLLGQYDSVSRLVFSGAQPHGVADYHLKMAHGKIHTILGRVQDQCSGLEQNVLNLKKAAEDTQGGVEQEATEIHHISHSVEKIVTAIDDVEQRITQASEQVEQANQQCINAESNMHQTKTAIDSLSGQIQKSSESSAELTQEAERIDAIMVEIKGIAEQTNLLALNAAIEAARAGESGRGFAVVADEVRNLSSRTNSATEQIQASISGMQETLRHWQSEMGKEKETVDHCVDQALQSQQSLSAVMGSMASISELSQQISEVAQHQAHLSKEISSNIEQIDNLSQHNAQQAEIVNSQSSDISVKATELTGLRDTFNERS